MMSYLETALIEVGNWARGTKGSAKAEAEHKQFLAEEKAGAEAAAVELRKRNGFGWTLQALSRSKRIRDIGLTDPMRYRELIFAVAAYIHAGLGGWEDWYESAQTGAAEDWELFLDGARISQRWHLTSAGINHDLSTVRRYLLLEKSMAEDVGPLSVARADAWKRLEAAKQAIKDLTLEYNAAYQAENSLKTNQRERPRIELNERRLFGTEDEIADTEELNLHYRISETPV